MRRVGAGLGFLGFFLRELTVANVQVALFALRPRPPLNAMIVAVPLRLQGDGPLTLLVAVITLMPGTVALGFSADQRFVYAHVIGTPSAGAAHEAILKVVAGTPAIALGDAVGTNVANVGLILGAALLISGLSAPRGSVRRDFPVALLAPLVTFAVVLDGVFSRLDAALFLALFAAWLAAVVSEVRRERGAGEGEPTRRRGPVVLSGLLGLALLVVAGRLIVPGAEGLAAAWGLDKFVVGATVVALATSTPELATTLIARWRGQAELGLGTILGSNIFNSLCIVGVVGTITPIPLDWRTVLQSVQRVGKRLCSCGGCLVPPSLVCALPLGLEALFRTGTSFYLY